MMAIDDARRCLRLIPRRGRVDFEISLPTIRHSRWLLDAVAGDDYFHEELSCASLYPDVIFVVAPA